MSRGRGDFPISIESLMQTVLPSARAALLVERPGAFASTELDDAAGEILLKQMERPFIPFDCFNHARSYYVSWLRMEADANRPVVHESVIDYSTRGCRCPECTEHMRLWKQGRRRIFSMMGLNSNGKAYATRKVSWQHRRKVQSAKMRRYRAAHPGARQLEYQRNREHNIARSMQWKRENRERVNALQRERRAARKLEVVTHDLIVPTLEVAA